MAQVLTVRHNDQDLQYFLKASPKRAALALRASMTKTGNFYQKKMHADIKNATYKKLHPASKSIRNAGKKPLEQFARLVRFRVSRSRKRQKLILKIGFMPTRIRGRAVRIGRQKLTPARVATNLERGRRQRLTDKWRRLLAARGYPVKKTTRYIETPPRPMVKPFWDRYGRTMKVNQMIDREFHRFFLDKKWRRNVAF